MIQEDANPFRQCFRSPNINGVEGLRRRRKYAGQQLYQSTFGEVCADREACEPRRGHACERESSDMGGERPVAIGKNSALNGLSFMWASRVPSDR